MTLSPAKSLSVSSAEEFQSEIEASIMQPRTLTISQVDFILTQLFEYPTKSIQKIFKKMFSKIFLFVLM